MTMMSLCVIVFVLLYTVHCAESGKITPANEKTTKADKTVSSAVNGTTLKLRSRAQLEEALEKLSASDAHVGLSLDRPDANGTVRYRLYYFDFPGRAEPIRLLFHYVGEPFEDFRIPHDKWAHQYKQSTTYGHVPVLIDRSGPVGDRTLAESYAILRFLARQYGLSGARQRVNRVEEAVEETPDDESDMSSDVTPSTDTPSDAWAEARVDEFADFHRDVADEFHGLFSGTPKPRTPEQIVRAAALADANFAAYERQLAERHGDGFLFGSAPTWPDFLVADFFEGVRDTFPRVLDAWPRLDAYHRRFRQLPALRDYFARRDNAAAKKENNN